MQPRRKVAQKSLEMLRLMYKQRMEWTSSSALPRSGSPAPAQPRGQCLGPSRTQAPLQSNKPAEHLPRVENQPQPSLHAALVFGRGTPQAGPELGGGWEAGGSAAPLPQRRQLLVPQGSKQMAESRWSQLDLVSLLCFIAREAQQILRASADQGERRRLGHGTGQLPSHPHQDISHVHRVLAGDVSSPVPRA